MILSICDSADVLSALRIVKIFIQFARIAIPIMLIVSISLDFFSAMTNGDSDALSRAARNSVSRAIATIVIFFIPQIISMTVSLATEDDSYKVCIKSATVENISKAYTEEATIYLKDAEKNLSRSSLNLAKRAVNRMLDDELKKQYLADIDNMEYVIIAKEWIARVRNSKSQSDYDKAMEAVENVPYDDMRAELEKELEKISLSMAQSIKEYSSNNYIVNPLGIPYYNQCDSRWGSTTYDSGGGPNGGMATLCSSSCGYTSLAMVVAGLSRDMSVVPLTMVELFRAPLPSHRGYGAASTSELSDNSKLSRYGIVAETIGTSHDSIMNALNAGKALVVLRPGHYVCLVGDGNGKIVLLDPYWDSRNGTYTIDQLEYAIQGSVSHAIAYSPA